MQRSDHGEPHRWVILEDNGMPVEICTPRSDDCGLNEKEIVVGDLLAGLSASLKIKPKPFPIKITKWTQTGWGCPGGVL